MTLEQELHNQKVERDILLADLEYERYLKRCKETNEAFRLSHPHLPEEILRTMGIPVRGKMCVIAIKYVD